MTQAIIFTNDNGGVSVCTPTGELTINEVLAKDCPVGAIIVDDSTLPQGADAEFFNAWELNGLTITVNLEKARTIKLNQFNTMALQTAQKRQLNTLAGIPNNISDADFAVVINVKNKITGKPRKIRMFPIKDENHVRNALARLPQATETLTKLGVSPATVRAKILKRAKEK